MRLRDFKNLHDGDEVYWTDPDEGKCSRYLTIREYNILDEDVGLVEIWDKDGSYLQCFLNELS